MSRNTYYTIKFHNTNNDEKWTDTEHTHTLIGDRESVWTIWYYLVQSGRKHVYIFDEFGKQCEPTKGLYGM